MTLSELTGPQFHAFPCVCVCVVQLAGCQSVCLPQYACGRRCVCLGGGLLRETRTKEEHETVRDGRLLSATHRTSPRHTSHRSSHVSE